MDFFIGVALGVGLTVAAWGVWQEHACATGVEKPDKAALTERKTWSQTKNFLYYDGTVMPEIKEDAHEH